MSANALTESTSHGMRWAFFPIAVGLIAIAFATYLAVGPLLRTVAIAATILLAGRAVFFWLVEAGEGEATPPMDGADANYMAIGLGGCMVLLLMGLARLASSYDVAVIIAALAAVTLCTFTRPVFRARVNARTLFGSGFLGCLGASILLWLIFTPENYVQLLGSSVYFAQGFDLLLPKDPSVWPYFGELYHMPFMYVTHMIGATFSIFSSGDHIAFFEYGQYWLNIILAPVMPLGAYLLFRKFLPWWASAPLALVFILRTVSFKTLSIRGETLGWIVGLGFLLGVCALLSRMRSGEGSRQPYGLMAATAMLYFGAALTHGVSAAGASFIAFGLFAHHLLARPERAQFVAALKFGGVGLLTLAVVGTVYWAGYLWGYDSPRDQAEVARAGEPDAALQIEAHFVSPAPVQIREVLASPPLISRRGNVAMTALLPPAMLHDEKIGRIPVSQYPQLALEHVHAMSTGERAFYLLAFALSWAVFLNRRFGAPSDSIAALFWAMVAGYIGFILLAVYLNEVSVSTFPVAATRRTYVYGEFFYWSAIFLALLRVASGPFRAAFRWRLRALECISGTINRRSRSYILKGRIVLGRVREVVGPTYLLLFIPLTIFLVVGLWEQMLPGPRFLFTQAGTKITALVASNGQAAQASARPGVTSGRADTYEVMNYIRDHTAPGEWVYSNVISDNQFWYLTYGRYSLGEGSAMYQLYPLQRRAARRLDQFEAFARTADRTIIAPYRVRYVVLLTPNHPCSSDGCSEFGFNTMKANLTAFEANPSYSLVFSNTKYLVYKRVDGDAGGID